MKIKAIACLLCLSFLFSGCAVSLPDQALDSHSETASEATSSPPSEPTDLGDDEKTFGNALDELGAYDGYFEGDSTDITVTCKSGTKNAYRMEGNTLSFTQIGEESVYSVSGKLRGSIVIDVGEDHKFDLELDGLSLVATTSNPITVKSGDEISIKAKKDSSNYIYDMRAAIDETDEALYSGAIHSEVDLEIAGKGSLTVISENNNGIHSKDDLEVKNLTLLVACVDHALKGNDSVEITNAVTTLIASGGDGIKTSSSDISSKGKQRGTVSITGGSHTVYAACDGIDAAYNVKIDGEDTLLNVYTDKYSNYSNEVTAVTKDEYYIRFSSQNYSYSVKFINSETGAYEWVNAEYHSKAQGGRSNYYYYAFPKKDGYDKLQFFVYSSGMELSQSENYAAASEEMALSEAYDTIALSNSSYNWTNYTTSVQDGFGGGFGGPGGPGGFGGPGGMQDGNSDKGDYSTKGIKAANEILILSGEINVKSYDDAIHANNDTTLENGDTPTGNVTIKGGSITLYSNDDGIHADGTLEIASGTVNVTNSYEGLEGTRVSLAGGHVSIHAKDDGINATATAGEAITVSGGTVYVYCSGDGIDSNSRTSYEGIVFSGGDTVIISTSGGNSAIDTEQGYTYTGGTVIAIIPRGGMSNEATHCKSFSSVGASSTLSLSENEYLLVTLKEQITTIQMPLSLSAFIVVLGDVAPNVQKAEATSLPLDANGVARN